ncbi:MAG: hypothetical protein LBU66_07780 [Treponema sp.]|nr:hypothetical protein [Treponema sp.]
MLRFIILFLILSFPCFAESEFSLRLAPALKSPLELEQFSSGMGADISLDWSANFPGNFAQNFNYGVNANGTFASLPVQVGDPLTLLEGRGGLFLRWLPRNSTGSLDRWAFQAGVNAGAYQHSRGEENDTRGLFGGTLNAQFSLSPYFSLYAETGLTYRVYSSEPLNTFDAAFGIKLNLTEIIGGRARVKVEKTQQYRVFPVSWAWYEDNPVAMLKITNEEPNSITDINFQLFIESYMSQPWTFAVLERLAPGESADIPVTALFNEAMMNLTETIIANGAIQIQYRSLGAQKETTSAIQMPIFHRNTLSWDDDRRAAAFVSPRDSAARLFARYVAGAVENEQFGNAPSNVLYAAALFEALRLYGITYVVVPATSFANVSADESVLDNVSYPYQALYYRGGDCSYLSILFCSMLEALKIESAFLTIPGHIYIAFEVGDENWQSNNRDIIELEIDGIRKRWLPVEITIPGQGFVRAWRVGARQWRDNVSNQLEQAALERAALYPIREAWKIYPPVTVPSSGNHPPEMPEWDEIIRALRNELRKIN